MFGLSYLVMASKGSPPPALYEHADGGAYAGQWRGAQKQGLGVYAYPGGGRCPCALPSSHSFAWKQLLSRPTGRFACVSAVSMRRMCLA